jgi:hypothetical protein
VTSVNNFFHEHFFPRVARRERGRINLKKVSRQHGEKFGLPVIRSHPIQPISVVVSTSVTVDGGPPSPATCNHRFRYYISRVTVTKAAAAKDGAKSATTMLALSSNPKNKSKNGSGGFESLYLSPPIFAGIKRLGYRTPTPVQRKSLPVLLTGSDAVVMARTGSEFR